MISESEFASVVEKMASGYYRVERVKFRGYTVQVTFRTNSGKGTWDSFLAFDPDDNWSFSYTVLYPGSAPWGFGNAIQERLRQIA